MPTAKKVSYFVASTQPPREYERTLSFLGKNHNLNITNQKEEADFILFDLDHLPPPQDLSQYLNRIEPIFTDQQFCLFFKDVNDNENKNRGVFEVDDSGVRGALACIPWAYHRRECLECATTWLSIMAPFRKNRRIQNEPVKAERRIKVAKLLQAVAAEKRGGML